MGNDAHSLSLFMVLTGSQPLTLVNTSIVFGMVVMPLTYYPILRAADTGMMGSHANNPSVTILGIIFLLLITLSAIVAILLMVLTHSGRP
jgi:Mn2+/Fe2+ NRAMP family transporter